MKSGDLNSRIVIKQLGAVDALGQPTGTPTTIATLYSKRQPQRGREVAASGTVAAEQTEIFTIRYRTDIQPKMILEYGGVRYQIEYIAEAVRREALDLVCRKFE